MGLSRTGRLAALWALFVIFLANFLNYVDRQLVSALEEPLSQAPLYLTKKEFGSLWTLFTVGYMLCAMPIGFLADRFSRPRIFAACILIWSVATIVSGMAEVKEVLYAARVFIGVGEAGCLVIGPSLISDLFRREVRGRALSVFFLGLPLGGTVAFIMAGVLYDFGWRNLFYLAGAPGFLVALLIALLPDPPRGAGEGAEHGMHGGGSFRQYLQLLRTKTLLLIILAQAAAVFFLVPLIHFGVEFFVDSRDMDKKSARYALGTIALIAGALGNTFSGFLGDRLARRRKGAYALLAGICFLIGWPCLLVGFFVEQREVFLPALTLGCFFYFICMPAVNTQIANVANPAQRASAWALAVFVMHLLGDMLAPWLFGLVIDSPEKGGWGINREVALALFSLGLGVAGLLCLVAVSTARKDTERVTQLVEEEAGV